MRSFATAAVLLALAAGPVSAQSSSDPTLAFTISGGMNAGGRLWNIDAQELVAPGATFDTVRLGRRMVPGISASLAMTLYRSPHFGLNGEIGYFGISSQQECTGPAAWKPDAESLNQNACSNANSRRAASSVIGFLGGVVYQFMDSSRVQPFVRVNAGVGLLGASFVETIGIVHHSSCITSDDICPYSLLVDRHKPSATWLVSLAGGFSAQLNPGYRVRMEIRDLILQVPTVTGPAAPSSTGNLADTKLRVKHVPVFMVGFDVMLERRRSRRY